MNAIGKEHLMPEIFSAVVVYEDRATRDRVLDVSRHMEAQVGDEIELRFSWWRFDFLTDPKLAEQAATAASVADMLLVSAHPGRGLPGAFTQWVETWLPKRNYRESVLVALIGSEQDSPDNTALEYLRGIATRARMDYLAKPLPLPAASFENLKDSKHEHSGARSPVAEAIYKHPRPPSHWGINE
jgi:hypothetical protein